MKTLHRIVYPILFMLLLQLPVWASGTTESEADTQEPGDQLEIFVSILPQQYFVQQIAGPDAEIRVMVPPGRSPATYEPTPKQVSNLGQADVFFTIGVPFEHAFIPIIRDEMKDLTIVDTSMGIQKRSIHGHDHDHESEQLDPHIWLAPPLVTAQAQNIRDGLIQIDPENEQLYQKNYGTFKEIMDELHAELKKTLEPVEGSTILVYHPSFGYFCEAYGLSQMAIEMGGKEPGPRQLQAVIATAKEHNSKVIFVQPEFSKDSAKKVADAIDGAVIEVAPLKPDYVNNMRTIAEAIRNGLDQ